MSKLIINIRDGILEIESDNDKLVEMVYSDFKNTIVNGASGKVNPVINSSDTKKKDIPSPENKIKDDSDTKKLTKKTKTNETYKLDPDINLWKTDTKQGLRDFYNEKAPSSGYECNVVFVYYLQKNAGVEKINPNHIYTCYKEVVRAYPNALRQNLIDTKRDKGWISTSDINAITLTSKGENYVEHDLPAKETSKKNE